jgi:hypothetical protein
VIYTCSGPASTIVAGVPIWPYVPPPPSLSCTRSLLSSMRACADVVETTGWVALGAPVPDLLVRCIRRCGFTVAASPVFSFTTRIAVFSSRQRLCGLTCSTCSPISVESHGLSSNHLGILARRFADQCIGPRITPKLAFRSFIPSFHCFAVTANLSFLSRALPQVKLAAK